MTECSRTANGSRRSWWDALEMICLLGLAAGPGLYRGEFHAASQNRNDYPADLHAGRFVL